MEQNIEYEPSVRYEADITQGLSQEQVRQRTGNRNKNISQPGSPYFVVPIHNNSLPCFRFFQRV